MTTIVLDDFESATRPADMSYDVNVVYGDCFISVIILIAQSAHGGNIVLTSPWMLVLCVTCHLLA